LLCDVETGTSASCSGGNVGHDTAGRLALWKGWTLGYDAESRLTSACKSPSCASGYDKVEFAYDGEGHRTKITATSSAGSITTTEFRYQGDAPVEEKVNGTVVRQYVTAEAGAITKVIIPAGQPNAGTYLVNWNGHGDALNLLQVNGDGTTTLANSFTYDTWGRPAIATHNGIGDVGFRFLYVGQLDVQWDDQFGLGLLYMHARHYSPDLGRFIQPDPIAFESNRYGYAMNSPVTMSDPSGMCFWFNLAQRAWQWLGSGGWPAVQRFMGSAWQWAQRVGTNIWQWTSSKWNTFYTGLRVAWNAWNYAKNISPAAWKKILASHHYWQANGVGRDQIVKLIHSAIQSNAMKLTTPNSWQHLRMDWVWINWGFKSICVHVYVLFNGVVRVENAWIITRGCP
jgi:RHS repeat-associated protein